MNTDIFFLSYSESNADENWQDLKRHHPEANRVHGIKGIKNAHKKVAEDASTDFFFVIDGDNKILPDFDFQIPQHLDPKTLYVWRAKNPVNSLCYGFGGIKLYNKWLLLENQKPTQVDIATSIAPKYIPVMIVASTTCFNATPLEAWRGAFREAAKLTLNVLKNPLDKASSERLEVWKTRGESAFNGTYAITGANMGYYFALKNKDNPIELARINDFLWLNSEYHSQASPHDSPQSPIELPTF